MWNFWRNWRKSAAEKQQEALNAYLDNALSPRQRAALEAELARNEDLRRELSQLQQVREGLRQLPRRRVPRNFTLDPALYGRPQRQPLVQAYPVLRLATGLTAFFFVLAIALQTLAPPRATFFTAAEPAALQAESVAMDAAPTLAAAEPAAASVPQVETGMAQETAVETMIVTESGEAAAEEVPAAAPFAEMATEIPTPTAEGASLLAAPAAAERQSVPESGLAAYPAPAAAPSPASTPDIPRPAQETQAARAAETGRETAEMTTAVAPTPTPETAVSTQFPPIPWLSVALGILLALLTILTLIARRRLV